MFNFIPFIVSHENLSLFQLTIEDDEILHLQDPVTGEINKDNFVSYSLERKLLDAQDTSARRKKMKKEDELNRKERLLRRQASFVQASPSLMETEKEKIAEETERWTELKQEGKNLSKTNYSASKEEVDTSILYYIQFSNIYIFKNTLHFNSDLKAVKW